MSPMGGGKKEGTRSKGASGMDLRLGISCSSKRLGERGRCRGSPGGGNWEKNLTSKGPPCEEKEIRAVARYREEDDPVLGR